MSQDALRIAYAQLNFTVGDIDGNAGRIIAAAARARDELAAQIVVFPELALSGYPPEDLLLRPHFHELCERALERIRSSVDGIHIVLGHPQNLAGRLYNACSVLRDGAVLGCYHKQHLPNDSVFDEKRYFQPGDAPGLLDIEGVPVALSICQDVWEADTVQQVSAAGARLLLNINASPYHSGKTIEREALLRAHHERTGMAILYLNLIGGQDELVFDGDSMLIDGHGRWLRCGPQFREHLGLLELGRCDLSVTGEVDDFPVLDEEEAIYRAVVLGVRDYIGKNGFPGAVIGLSGGIDSALTLAIAVDAIGAERVEVVLMPSRYTAGISITDAVAEADTLGVVHHSIPIEPVFQAFTEALKERFRDIRPDTTEENIQARSRGVILMAISNKSGRILLTTGNKSEMAVGYATLYGDMAGGFAPLKDIAKTLVYRLAEWRNRDAEVIPRRVIERPPSAELAPDQKDADSLPPYDILDPILQAYIEEDQPPHSIVAAGFDRKVVARVVKLVDRNEYKRRQAAPGVRITRRAFGRDRRYPITSGYDELGGD